MQTTTEITPNVATQATSATTVDTKDFTRELEWVARFADKKTSIPILANVSITSRSGQIRLIATDLEIAGITNVTGEGSDFDITVPTHLALKYLKKVSEASVSLEVRNNWLVIRHGEDSEATIPGMSRESFPELPALGAMTERYNLKGLNAALPRVLPCISAEESRFTLNGALLEVSDAGAKFISTDGHRLSIGAVESSTNTPLKALIPRKALAEVNRLGEDSMEFGQNENHVCFIGARRVIISRKLTGKFPDYERVIPKTEHCAAIDADALRKHGERVALFADERSRAVKLTLADNKLTVSAYVSEGGKAKASVATTWEQPEWVGGFNWDYIMDFLKLAPKTAFDLKFNFQTEKMSAPPAVMLSIEGWDYILMPMRI
jgi:DNA polymerase-3 subunit beta